MPSRGPTVIVGSYRPDYLLHYMVETSLALPTTRRLALLLCCHPSHIPILHHRLLQLDVQLRLGVISHLPTPAFGVQFLQMLNTCHVLIGCMNQMDKLLEAGIVTTDIFALVWVWWRDPSQSSRQLLSKYLQHKPERNVPRVVVLTTPPSQEDLMTIQRCLPVVGVPCVVHLSGTCSATSPYFTVHSCHLTSKQQALKQLIIDAINKELVPLSDNAFGTWDPPGTSGFNGWIQECHRLKQKPPNLTKDVLTRLKLLHNTVRVLEDTSPQYAIEYYKQGLERTSLHKPSDDLIISNGRTAPSEPSPKVWKCVSHILEWRDRVLDNPESSWSPALIVCASATITSYISNLLPKVGIEPVKEAIPTIQNLVNEFSESKFFVAVVSRSSVSNTTLRRLTWSRVLHYDAEGDALHCQRLNAGWGPIPHYYYVTVDDSLDRQPPSLMCPVQTLSLSSSSHVTSQNNGNTVHPTNMDETEKLTLKLQHQLLNHIGQITQVLQSQKHELEGITQTKEIKSPDKKDGNPIVKAKTERARQQLMIYGEVDKNQHRGPPPTPWPLAGLTENRLWSEDDARQLWNFNYQRLNPRHPPVYYFGETQSEEGEVLFTADTELYCRLPPTSGGESTPVHLLGKGRGATKREAKKQAAIHILKQMASLGILRVPTFYSKGHASDDADAGTTSGASRPGYSPDHSLDYVHIPYAWVPSSDTRGSLAFAPKDLAKGVISPPIDEDSVASNSPTHSLSLVRTMSVPAMAHPSNKEITTTTEAPSSCNLHKSKTAPAEFPIGDW